MLLTNVLDLLCCSCATKKVKGRLRKAGVTLTYSSLSLSSITGLQLQLASVSGRTTLLLTHMGMLCAAVL
jgi:hypothetical protein